MTFKTRSPLQTPFFYGKQSHMHKGEYDLFIIQQNNEKI